MSHAAIVCRELGIPCVAGTRDGTRRLKDGARIRVDGTNGKVRVL
jgi:pyruvate,water dikinase